jgi:uncharacterized protein (UPF0332 family)
VSDPVVEIYLSKARESLAGAANECANGRYDNCANRSYYACFQAAVAALVRARIGPPNQAEQWGHDFVQARFIGDLINRRKRYPVTLRQTLIRGLRLRQTADYKLERVSGLQATRALVHAQEFVSLVVQDVENEG